MTKQIHMFIFSEKRIILNHLIWKIESSSFYSCSLSNSACAMARIWRTHLQQSRNASLTGPSNSWLLSAPTESHTCTAADLSPSTTAPSWPQSPKASAPRLSSHRAWLLCWLQSLPSNGWLSSASRYVRGFLFILRRSKLSDNHSWLEFY